MLPTSPKSRTASHRGLPSAPRSRSVGRSRPDDTSKDDLREQSTRSSAPSARRVRPQRSLASIPSVRDPSQRAPPVPELRHASRPVNASRGSGRADYDDRRKYSDASSSSVSSSGSSSLLGRMRGRSGETSSQTSFELEDEEAPKRGWPSETHSIRERRIAEESRPYTEQEPEDNIHMNGEGYNIWSRVATAASTLTVSVSKAWQTNVPTYMGEETPPGRESRLARAMKAYHLEKARDPTDLPEWLFEEHERRPVGRSRVIDRGKDEDRPEARSAPVRTRGLRDIYDAAATNTAPERSTPPSKDNYVYDITPSKATDRLRALRDAKRNAQTATRYDDPPVRSDSGYDRRPRAEEDSRTRIAPINGERRPPPRIGLPSGVRARRY